MAFFTTLHVLDHMINKEHSDKPPTPQTVRHIHSILCLLDPCIKLTLNRNRLDLLHYLIRILPKFILKNMLSLQIVGVPKEKGSFKSYVHEPTHNFPCYVDDC